MRRKPYNSLLGPRFVEEATEGPLVSHYSFTPKRLWRFRWISEIKYWKAELSPGATFPEMNPWMSGFIQIAGPLWWDPAKATSLS